MLCGGTSSATLCLHDGLGVHTGDQQAELASQLSEAEVRALVDRVEQGVVLQQRVKGFHVAVD